MMKRSRRYLLPAAVMFSFFLLWTGAAYADNIDEFFRAYTRFSVRENGKPEPGRE